MSEKTLKFNNITVNKKEFHKSKEPIDLSLVFVDRIVISDKFKMMVLNILLVIKKEKFLNRCVLYYHK